MSCCFDADASITRLIEGIPLCEPQHVPEQMSGYRPIDKLASPALRQLVTLWNRCEDEAAALADDDHRLRLAAKKIAIVVAYIDLLMNREAGEKYSRYSLKLAARGSEIFITAHLPEQGGRAREAKAGRRT